MKLKLAAIALIASVTLSCDNSFGCELLDRMLGRAGCSSCEAPQAPSCGCGGGLMDKIVGKSAGCGCCGDDMLTYDANMSCGPVASSCGCESAPAAPAAPCGCEAPAAVQSPCGCDAAPVETSCGCDAVAAPASTPNCGGLGLFSKFGNRGCGCGTPEPVIAPVADCGCSAPAPVADCGCSAPAPAPVVADCGCDAAPVVSDCGCDAPAAAPFGGAAAAKKSCLLGLFNKFKKPSIAAPVAATPCGYSSPAPVADCGCGSPVVESDCGCGSPAPEPVADCGCAAPAVQSDCGCGSPAPAADCGCAATAAPARNFFSAVRPAAGGCGCGSPAVESPCGGSAVSTCGCDSTPRGKLTLLDRLRGNRIPRTREGVVIGSQCNDGCNSPCPQQPADCGCGTSACGEAPVYQAAPCTSCGGGEVIYSEAQPSSGCTSCGGSQSEVIYGSPVTLPAETAAGSQEATNVAPPVVPATESNATEGVIESGDGTSEAAPVVDPGAFIPKRRSTVGA